ncbi:hypothetical protein GCM10010269_05030 [Streptomyces humidus]|uniref:Uncharacterized protein n=1 Tax=Streptomyces humidus TaxID=52259 RepID=A0A918FQM6_9ACTN|nr:hypothetical protein GCM10010269_05030 [Streptomyces humidus]
MLTVHPGATALRRLLSTLMDFEEVNRFMTGMITAVGVRYDFGEGHELLGRRLRDVELRQGRRLYELMHAGHGLLLDRTGELSVQGWAGRGTLGAGLGGPGRSRRRRQRGTGRTRGPVAARRPRRTGR